MNGRILFFVIIVGMVLSAIVISNLGVGSNIRKNYKQLGVLQWISPLALWIYKQKVKFFGDNQVNKQFRELYPNQDITEKIHLEYIHRIGIVLLCLLLGGILGIFLEIQQKGKDSRIHTLERPEFLEGNVTYDIMVEGLGEEKELTFEVGEQLVTREQFEKMCISYIPQIQETLLGENSSLEQIKSNLYYIKSINGISISWESSDFDYIGEDGTIKKWAVDNPIPIEIYATFSYETLQYTHTFVGSIVQREKDTSYYLSQIQEYIKNENEQSREKESIELPNTVDGVEVSYKKRVSKDSFILFFLCVLGGIGVYARVPEKRKEELKKREQQLIMDYTTIIFQLSLLIQSGLTIRGSIQLMIRQYEKDREHGEELRYSFEELKMTYYSLEAGYSERYAYEEFGTRCGMYCYIKLGNLLSQNIRQGVSGLGNMLEEEAFLVLEERKNTIKKMGEEATTKLLIPMVLMLLVICIILVVPTFLSM